VRGECKASVRLPEDVELCYVYGKGGGGNKAIRREGGSKEQSNICGALRDSQTQQQKN